MERFEIIQGWYSETGYHIGMDRNFVCLWGRHNCNWSLPFCTDSWIMKSIIGFLNNSNLHEIISTLLIINLQWVYKIYFAVLEEIYNNVVPLWSAILSHAIIQLQVLSLLQKTVQILSVYGPFICSFPYIHNYNWE